MTHLSVGPDVPCSAGVRLDTLGVWWLVGVEHGSLKLWAMSVVPSHSLSVDGLHHIVDVSRLALGM